MRAERADNAIRQLLDSDIRAVDLNVGARVGVRSLGHQLFHSFQSGFTTFGQFRAPGFRSFDARRDDLSARRQANDHANSLERHAIRLINQHAASGRDNFGMRSVAMRASPPIAGQMRDRFTFEPAEMRLAVVGKYPRDRFSSQRDNHRIHVHELPPEPPRNQRPDRAFPGSHKSSENQFGRHLRCRAALRGRVQ